MNREEYLAEYFEVRRLPEEVLNNKWGELLSDLEINPDPIRARYS